MCVCTYIYIYIYIYPAASADRATSASSQHAGRRAGHRMAAAESIPVICNMTGIRNMTNQCN